MATISDKLIQLKNIKQDIKEAINSGGGSVGDDFSTYAGEVSRITSYENPDFYDMRTAGGTNYKYLFAYYPYNKSLDIISNWDTSRVTNMEGTFYECKAASPLDLSNWNTSNVTDMSYMFNNCGTSIEGMENWDLSKVTNTSYMFYYFTNSSSYLDLSPLDFSKAKYVNYMFAYSNTDYLDVRNIDLSGATDYGYLFNQCDGIELDLSSWNVSNVTNLNRAFYQSDYNKIDLTGWNTVNVTNMGYLFNYADLLETLIIPDWDMTNTTTITNMFSNTKVLKYIDASRCNATTMTKLASALQARKLADYGEIITPADLTQETINALTAKYWKPIGPKIDLVSTELLFELDEIKPGKTTKVWTYNSEPWYGDDRLETIEYVSSDESVATTDGKKIIGVSEGTTDITAVRREDNVVLSTAPITLTVSETDSNPNLIKFRTNGNEASYSNVIIVNDKGIRADQCTKDAIGIYSYDPGVQITSIQFGSSSYKYTNEIIKFNFNAANIANTSQMFMYYQGTTLDLSDWDTSKLTNLTSLFFVAELLTKINVSGWDTSNVTNMYCMFYGCKSLTELDLSSWDTSKVTSMHSMFHRCNNLQTINGEIDMSNSNPKDGYWNYEMFTQCYNLETVYLKNIYKNSDMTNKKKYSIDLGDTKVKDECLLYIINELPDLYNDKGLTKTDELYFTLPKANTLTAEQVQVAVNKGWEVRNCNY